eukprot:s3927_g1.t1
MLRIGSVTRERAVVELCSSPHPNDHYLIPLPDVDMPFGLAGNTKHHRRGRIQLQNTETLGISSPEVGHVHTLFLPMCRSLILYRYQNFQ